MENSRLSTNATAFGISLVVASITNALLVAAKEKSPKVLAFMKGLTGHHWITHCTFIILLFLVLGWILSHTTGDKGIRMTSGFLNVMVVGGVILSGVIIVGFYLIVG